MTCSAGCGKLNDCPASYIGKNSLHLAPLSVCLSLGQGYNRRSYVKGSVQSVCRCMMYVCVIHEAYVCVSVFEVSLCVGTWGVNVFWILCSHV